MDQLSGWVPEVTYSHSISWKNEEWKPYGKLTFLKMSRIGQMEPSPTSSYLAAAGHTKTKSSTLGYIVNGERREKHATEKVSECCLPFPANTSRWIAVHTCYRAWLPQGSTSRHDELSLNTGKYKCQTDVIWKYWIKFFWYFMW